MRYRKRQIAWSVFWGFATVLLIVLWMRSYLSFDYAERLHPNLSVSFGYTKGEIGLGIWRQPQGSLAATRWTLKSYSNSHISPENRYALRGFQLFRQPNGWEMWSPLWFAVLVSSVLTVAPWIRLRPQFSLRTLLIATTLVAIVLGLVMWPR